MTNFDFLKNDPQFFAFADTAIAAERVYQIDTATCAVSCRRAMEFAIKWMYSVDGSLVMPYQDKLVSLMNTVEFVDIVDKGIWKRLDYIRTLGNNATHTNRKISAEQARLALENLFVFLDFIAYCYAKEYTERKYDPALLEQKAQPTSAPADTLDLDKLMAENAALKAELTARRAEQEKTYVQKPLEFSEYKTRKIYIDTMLQDAGWVEGKDWINEFELPGMPNKSGVGYADYVLFGDDGRPLAVLEAKRTCKDVAVGRQQAKLYADLLEQKYGRRPIIFLSNGFDTRIWNDRFYPEHQVAGIYSKRDLEKEFNKLTLRTHLDNVQVSDSISGRYYQKDAIKAVCGAFDKDNRRKALLVMATGSGKTRTVISLVDVLLRHGWVKNVLFLADRNSLVTQAKRSFVNLLPDLSITNLCEDKDNLTARAVFSTYQTMMNCIDDSKDENGGKLFTVGHFDLIIVDEAHRSIYRKYRDIFTYFDALLVGLTATPRDEIDKNTYSIFELENGVPTYGYELAQAVQDKFLVDFMALETTLKFPSQGIHYDDLTEEEREEYEDSFADEEGKTPDEIGSTAINDWVFNEDTIRKVLNILMTQGIRVDYGNKLGKTILFAANHRHAEEIYRIFGKEYPAYHDYAKVIDNYTNYAQSAIDEFSEPNKMPQIAISVDMLDTGIDVPEVVNLVFFKKVRSKAKFWQMIGRGTRLCPGLLDGEDKKQFYIFDFCNNFEFFRMHPKGKNGAVQESLQERLFNLKANIALKLQDLKYQTEELRAFRKELVADMAAKIKELPRDNFAVCQHLKFVDLYSNENAFTMLSYENTLQLADEVAPLLLPYEDDANALRFDSLLYGIELASLVNNTCKKARRDLLCKVQAIAAVANIPQINAQSELLNELLHTDYLENANIPEFEHIRAELRDLVKYIPFKERTFVNIDLKDEILASEWKSPDLENDDLKNYKLKVNYYIRQHQDERAISKLKTNKPLTSDDIRDLEKILWSDLGTKQDYEREFGAKPMGELVREIVGLDMVAAKAAFSRYLNDTNLDSRQIYFVNQIVNYIVQNGVMKDLSLLQQPPFNDNGSFAEFFDTAIILDLRKIIDAINRNAAA